MHRQKNRVNIIIFAFPLGNFSGCEKNLNLTSEGEDLTTLLAESDSRGQAL